MITELPARFQILATGTHYYDVDVEAGTLTAHGDVFSGYTEGQMINYIKRGVWKITLIYQDRYIEGKDVSDLL